MFYGEEKTGKVLVKMHNKKQVLLWITVKNI